jgi:hypothetical protein
VELFRQLLEEERRIDREIERVESSRRAKRKKSTRVEKPFAPKVDLGEYEIPYIIAEDRISEYESILDSSAYLVGKTLYMYKVKNLNKRISDLNTMKEMQD